MSSIIMYSDKDIGAGAFLFTVIGLILWVIGGCALHYRKKSKEDQELDVRGIKLANTICFVISILVLAIVVILPILGSAGIL